MKRFVLISLILIASMTMAAKWIGIGNVVFKVGGGGLAAAPPPPPTGLPPYDDDLDLWLDAADSSTIATTSTGRVTTWLDKSASAKTFYQGDSRFYPWYSKNNYVQWNADWVKNAGLWSGSANRSIFIVLRVDTMDDYAGTGYCQAMDGTAGYGQYWTFNPVNISTWAVSVRGGYCRWNQGPSIGNYQIIGVVLDGNNTTDLEGWMNGAKMAVSATSSRTINTIYGTAGLRIGAIDHVSTQNARMREMLSYDRALTSNEVVAVFNYLNSEWSVY